MTTYALPRRPRLGLFFVTLLAVVLAAPSARTQTYPSRPVTFVVPFAPGGLSDVPARVLAAEMQDRIGQSIVVENKSGASGVTGATSVWRAEPDGYTLLVNALADVQNLHYIPVPYNAVTDFALIGQITEGPPLVLIVNANLPYKSVAELVADAKANPNKIELRDVRTRDFAGHRGDPAQRAGRHQDRGRSLSRVRPGRGRGGDGRSPGRLRVLLQRQAAVGRRQGARPRDCQLATACELAGHPDHGQSSAFPASIIAASSASRHRARRRHRSSPSSTSISTTPSIPPRSADAWSRSA